MLQLLSPEGGRGGIWINMPLNQVLAVLVSTAPSSFRNTSLATTFFLPTAEYTVF